MRIKNILSVLFGLLWWNISPAQTLPPPTCERAYTMPDEVMQSGRHSLLLNGIWQFKYSAGSRWTSIRVPGEAAMQGYAIRHDRPFFYKKELTVPAGFAGHRTILRFDGVYSQARLWVNGVFVREHHGGFTRWETDITPLVKPGKKNKIELEVTDRLDDISYASGYAHHPVGGILRDVTLFALPETHLYDLFTETRLDSLYRDAVLSLSASAVAAEGDEVLLQLTAPDGSPVTLGTGRFPLPAGESRQTWRLPVKNPLKWDAEHPNLYTLHIDVRSNGKTVSRTTRAVGFRQVEIKGDRMLVNGWPVKLRGACRHDIHPELGRTTTAMFDSLDARLFKQANMNFVRTSHYPPSEKFLEYCNRYGIYVECETAVCFVNTYRQKNYAPGNSQDDPVFTERYLGQCREMVKSFRSHPSVLFWSIGNESAYGSNFQQCRDWIRKVDPHRPVIFSYPGSQDKGENKIYDLLSMHYPGVDGNLSQWNMTTRGFQGHGIPALFDEWAHPACYTYATLQNDPNIREFWGKSLDLMWSNLFRAPGGLGGAIWGYIDETFMLPEPKQGSAFWKEFARTAKPENYRGKCVGYGEWGIVDVWRRQKPEFWSTQKAYSPIRISGETITAFTAGQKLLFPVYNRFDHTYLNEITARYIYRGVKKEFPLEAVAPHGKGILQLPADDWENGEPLVLEFFSAGGMLIDAYRFTLGTPVRPRPEPVTGRPLTVIDSDSMLVVNGDGFEIPFDKSTGLITGARTGGRIVIEKGPFLNLRINLNHLTGAEVRRTADHFSTDTARWEKTGFGYHRQGEDIYIDLAGTCREVTVRFEIKITPGRELSVQYRTSGAPDGYLRETGLAFRLPDVFRHLAWKRKGYWNYYPENAFAGNEGHTQLYNPRYPAYGERPDQPWQADTHNYYYWADAGAGCEHPLTNAAKGMKENIYSYILSADSAAGTALSVISPDASVACRLHKNTTGQLILYADNRWDYPEIAWGNYCKTLEALPCFGVITIRLKAGND